MYEKQTWATGDVITEEKLNHMEDGIANGGGVKVYNAVASDSTETIEIDMSIDEFNDILQNKTYCLVKYGDEGEVYIMPLVRVDDTQKRLSFGGITCLKNLGMTTIETTGLDVSINKEGGIRCIFSHAYLGPSSSNAI